MHSYYYEDNLSALQAKFAAQKLAFAPAAFQTAKAMVDLHILQAIEDSKTAGLTIEAIIGKTADGVQLEFGVGKDYSEFRTTGVCIR